MGIFRHLRPHRSGGDSYNFLLADQNEVAGAADAAREIIRDV